MKREEFIGHFNALFFSSTASRLDIQLLSPAKELKQQAAWVSNGRASMFTKVLARTQHSGSFVEFKLGATYHPDAVIEAFKNSD